LDTKKGKVPMEHLNIGEFNRGQSSKLIRGLAEEDKTAFILICPRFMVQEQC